MRIDFKEYCIALFARKYSSCHKILICLFAKYFVKRKQVSKYKKVAMRRSLAQAETSSEAV